MTVIVQDNTGLVVNANAYADEAYYRAYFLLRGIDVTAQTQADVEAGLINSTDYMDIRFEYIGVKTGGDDQTTALPRTYPNPNYSDVQCGYSTRIYPPSIEVATIESGITDNIKNASCEYAYNWITGGKDLTATFTADEQKVKRIKSKVDVLEEEKEYWNGSVSAFSYPIYQKADSLMYRSNLIYNSSSVSYR